jgi:hypothetical protein
MSDLERLAEQSSQPLHAVRKAPESAMPGDGYSAHGSDPEPPADPEQGFVFAARLPPARLGVAVVSDLVEAIVTGQVRSGQLLPPEGPLAERFGVSRTVTANR